MHNGILKTRSSNILDAWKVSILDNYNIAEKKSPATTFLGVSLNPEGIPVSIFKSLASIIGINHARTKLCPFCEETIKQEARTCRFCNRILMRQISINQPGRNCDRLLK